MSSGTRRMDSGRRRPLSRGVSILIALSGSIIVLAAAVLALLISWSPGKAMPLVDGNGRPMPDSISEKIFVDINGATQGMFVKSANRTNPVLLFVHGGLGMPEYFLNEKHPTGLEKYFTVCWWERRGAGLSYSPGIKARTGTPCRPETHHILHR